MYLQYKQKVKRDDTQTILKRAIVFNRHDLYTAMTLLHLLEIFNCQEAINQSYTQVLAPSPCVL
jgi:hypothetical protein